MLCAECGNQNRAAARFCDACGGLLNEHPRPDTAADDPILDGERKQVTILFADVKGSMDLQQDLDAEVWTRIMAGVFQRLSGCVRRYGGTVDKFTGDGLMATFGAPVAQEDHAARGCMAALDMVGDVRAYVATLARPAPDLHVRIGLNSGEVVAGGIGDGSSMAYTAIGHTVGLAQRMESAAPADSVAVSASTAGLVGRRFALRSLGAMRLKGVRDPAEVFVLDGRPELVERRAGVADAAAMVGRETELETLRAVFELARSGQHRVVGVVADAGVGKSRLCEEFLRERLEHGATIRRAAGVSHATSAPLLAVLALMRQSFGINASDSPAVARDRVARVARDADLLGDLPLLLDFLQIADPDDHPSPMVGEVRMRRLLAALERVTRPGTRTTRRSSCSSRMPIGWTRRARSSSSV